VSGQIVSAGSLSGVGGASLVFGDGAPLTSEGDGSFAIVTTDASTKPLILNAPGYLARETSLTGGAVRSNVLFNLLPTDGSFPLQQYRDLVRNGYEKPNTPEPSRHWTADPNVIVWTTFKDTGQIVSPAFLQFLESELRRLIPAWTAGRFQLGRFETTPTEPALQKGWIKVQFSWVGGNWSLLGEDPGWINLGSDAMCQSIAIAHEFGHALGYWHTRVKPSIMGGGPGSCNLTYLSPDEEKIARAMYSRDPGNVDPDKDGPAPAPMFRPTSEGSALSAPFVLRCDSLLQR
jgi:hypothetical protein